MTWWFVILLGAPELYLLAAAIALVLALTVLRATYKAFAWCWS